MTSATGRSTTEGSWKARSSRERSLTEPTTSASDSGGSALTTGIWETPNSFSRAMADAHRLVGVDVDQRGQLRGPALAAHDLGDGLAAGPEEPVVGHPLVVVDLGQVAPTGVGQQDHDDGVGAEVAADLQGGPDRGAARPAGQDALLPREPPGGEERVPVAHHHHPVDHRRVVGPGPEVLADALDQVGPAAAARVHRALGVGADDLDGRVAGPSGSPPDAGDGAAGADAGHEVGDPARRLLPDLRAGRGLVGGRVVPGCGTGRAGRRPGWTRSGAGPPSSTTRGARVPPRSGTR